MVIVSYDPVLVLRSGFVVFRDNVDNGITTMSKREGRTMKMEMWGKIAVAVIVVGLASLVVGVIGKMIGSSIIGFSPRGFGGFAGICFLLSINLLLLEKRP